jgi:DNA-binding NtrC family response regulator
MALLPSDDWDAAKALAAIPSVNPFLEERVELERRAIGHRYLGVGPVLTIQPGQTGDEMYPELPALREQCERLFASLRKQLDTGRDVTPTELEVYEGLAFFLIYLRFTRKFESLVSDFARSTDGHVKANFWPEFVADFERLFRPEGRTLPSDHRPEVILAVYFQIERAYVHIYEKIVGGSMPAARLRAAVWESIFSHDMRRYLRVLHGRMSNLPTLIVGPSGSGKELVASAIANSSFIPFDPADRRFKANKSTLYVPVNLSALTPTLIESELFGHAKGSFNGAEERDGWLKKCDPNGAVFLDEIGELDGSIQVKLLRVLETRRFEPVGSTKTLVFEGRIIAATNRDLAEEMDEGRFRHDLFYRLCADQVTTPSLAEQLSDRPDDLVDLVRFAARRILDLNSEEAEDEEERLTKEVVAWIEKNLGDGYPWPGNFRELGQCVRNVMVRGRYLPPSRSNRKNRHGPVEELLAQVRETTATSDELLGRYYALVLHESEGNYREAGRRLKVDPRTVRDLYDRAFYDRLKRAPNP